MMMKLPKELDLPQMKDHQMFDRPRIVQLQNELQDKFKSLKVFICVKIYVIGTLSFALAVRRESKREELSLVAIKMQDTSRSGEGGRRACYVTMLPSELRLEEREKRRALR